MNDFTIRSTSTVVDRDRIYTRDIGKDRYPYTKIPTEDVPRTDVINLDETIYMLQAIANDKKRLYTYYFDLWIKLVNSLLRRDTAEFRVYGMIMPDYRYKIIKFTATPDNPGLISKQRLMDLLAIYMQNKYSKSGVSIDESGLTGYQIKTLDVIECPFMDYFGFIRSQQLIIIVPQLLHEQIFKLDHEIVTPEWIKELINEAVAQYGVETAYIDLENNEVGVQRPEPNKDEDPTEEESDDDNSINGDDLGIDVTPSGD